jgi:hypothetical protein
VYAFVLSFSTPDASDIWLGLVHDNPHFLANFSTVRSILDFHSPFQFLFFYFFCVIPVHYITPEPNDAFILSSQKQFPSFYSYRSTPCDDDSPQQAIARYQRVKFFPGIRHLLMAVVLTKRNILHIFPIRS